jgi:hypothetical protein
MNLKYFDHIHSPITLSLHLVSCSPQSPSYIHVIVFLDLDSVYEKKHAILSQSSVVRQNITSAEHVAEAAHLMVDKQRKGTQEGGRARYSPKNVPLVTYSLQLYPISFFFTTSQ